MFMLLKVLLIHFLPEPPCVGGFFKKTRGLHRLYHTFTFHDVLADYGAWYYARRKEVAAWHQKHLERFDPVAKIQLSSLRFVIACREAEKAGIDSSNVRYPSFAKQFAKPGAKDEHQPGTISD